MESKHTPELIRGWTAPFHVTMDGIKDDKGCWICGASNSRLAHQLVELMNFAAAVPGMLEALKLVRADAAYHLEKYRPHCLEAVNAALAQAGGRQP